MHSDLDQLPEKKRHDLQRALEVLFSQFEEALKGKLSPERKQGRILKVILYGSQARGKAVRDPAGGYISDYDLLVVVNGEEFTDPDYWEGAEDRFLRESLINPMRHPIQFIVHSLSDVNDQLSRGRYFFMDIVREGIVLYEAEGHPFAEPKPLSPEAAHEEAQGYFDYWFPSAVHFLELAHVSIKSDQLREAAFLMHQATERLYHCMLLVLTLYTPKLHNIEKLRKECERLDTRLIAVWPRDTRQARRFFEKLRRAYVEARYSKHYEITAEELAWLGKRVAVLQNIVRSVCEERLMVSR
ncbi:HEPN domain-containing protein [Microvirga puerhi]|uniref:HEPN domain-containing protein n=1 Tax=Microvirga puerhi TaxID=2876078 RepID=A0ABS7VKD0_9HYPH|nr:HEPN domain-containing protein [Microvirga puerhi]MBZ6075986.1 HEPN domain-containing protein [Microvirga puerhi]